MFLKAVKQNKRLPGVISGKSMVITIRNREFDLWLSQRTARIVIVVCLLLLVIGRSVDQVLDVFQHGEGGALLVGGDDLSTLLAQGLDEDDAPGLGGTDDAALFGADVLAVRGDEGDGVEDLEHGFVSCGL